jgi:putative FmdB family regulatory protein
MPVYEFYCRQCHVIFNFLSPSVNTTAQPSCPRCKKTALQRRISLFAISKGRPDTEGEEGGLPDLDDAQMERAMQSLAREADGLNEDDPRAVARLMRKLYDQTGLQLGEGMQEAMRRLESGEDPDQIEEEMGELLDGDDVLLAAARGKLQQLSRRRLPPEVDPTLYDL